MQKPPQKSTLQGFKLKPGSASMIKYVKKDELSEKSGLVAVNREQFTEDEIGKLILRLEKFALFFDGD